MTKRFCLTYPGTRSCMQVLAQETLPLRGVIFIYGTRASSWCTSERVTSLQPRFQHVALSAAGFDPPAPTISPQKDNPALLEVYSSARQQQTAVSLSHTLTRASLPPSYFASSTAGNTDDLLVSAPKSSTTSHTTHLL